MIEKKNDTEKEREQKNKIERSLKENTNKVKIKQNKRERYF